MKKKASLLISGITTVAMLAVAVGSFAAWDKLTDSPEGNLTVNVGNPVVLEVGNVTAATSVKLAKLEADKDLKDDTRSDKASLGSFNAKLTNTDNVAAGKIQTTYSITPGGTADSSLYDIYLTKNSDGSNKINSSTDLALLSTDTPFYVFASIKADSSEADVLKDAGKDLTATVELTTANVPTQP